MSNLGDVSSKTKVIQTYHRQGSGGGAPSRRRLKRSGGRKPPEAGQYFGKTRYFNAIGSHSARVQNHLKELNF